MKTIVLVFAMISFNINIMHGGGIMGKTWVVFIENSEYELYENLTESSRDIQLMKNALSNYRIDSIIHKKNLTKNQMMEFFDEELRESIIENKVNSLLVWYAGHGKNIDNTGYWLPVDARIYEMNTLYKINYLRNALQEYSEQLKHTLVITDAAESGPTFFQAMRSIPQIRNCDEITVAQNSSSQTIVSSGYDFAPESSVFTRTFSTLLTHNMNPCMPIENVVNQLIMAASRNNQPIPRFGKITGLPDEGGTFFFIKND